MSHSCVSHKQSLNGHLHGLDLGLELGALLDGDRGCDDRPGHPTGAPQGLLGAHKHVGDVLVLAEQREVQDDLQGLGVGRHHDEL